MIRKKVKHIYFKSFIDNADIINTHNYFTSYSEFFIVKNTLTENTVKINSEISVLNNVADIDDVIFLRMLNLELIVLKND